MKKNLNAARGRRKHSWYIDHLDFRRCLKNWDRPDTFFFLDPPYPDSTPYRRGLKPFTWDDHEGLAALLNNISGKWLLTYNDHPRVRELYASRRMIPVSTKLNTDKIPHGRSRRSFRQLIITNYLPQRKHLEVHG